MSEAAGRVRVAPGAEENGLAALLSGLVEGNLEAHPGRLRLLERLELVLGLESTDAEVRLTMRFAGGRLTLEDGLAADAAGVVRGTSDAILDLTQVPTGWGGLPIPWSRAARQVGRRIREKELELPSLRLVPRLLRVAALLSVAE